MKITNPTFDLNNQAMAVLHYLAGRSPDFAYEEGGYKVIMKTSTWYNGRERGFVVSMSKDHCDWLHIAVFEHRNSDNICAIKCVDKYYMNPPTIESHGKKFYPTDNKHDIAYSVGPGEVGAMADWIYGQLETYYKNS